MLPVLAKAVEALCALDELELENLRGGTFVRMPNERFGWLAGLVKAPSARLDGERDELVARLRAKNDAFHERFGRPPDDRLGSICPPSASLDRGVARAAAGARDAHRDVLAADSRAWGWGGTNPHVPEAVRRASSAASSTPSKSATSGSCRPRSSRPTSSTAWALAAFVCDRAKGDAVVCVPENEGLRVRA